MPEADTFSFYGTVDTSTPANSAGGEAFPFCVEKVDVSGFDYWTTLGGFNKDSGGSPTQEQIGNSWINACKLYWNLYAIEGNTNGTTLNANAEDNLIDGFSEPKNRQCKDISDFYGTYFGDGPLDQITIGTSTYANFYNEFSNVVKMYNGATDEPENFVGYGIRSDVFNLIGNNDLSGLIYRYLGTNIIFADIYLCSYGDMISASQTNVDIAYVNFSGIDFLVVVAASSDGTLAPVADAQNLTGTCYDFSDNSFTVTLDSLEFYTYA